MKEKVFCIIGVTCLMVASFFGATVEENIVCALLVLAFVSAGWVFLFMADKVSKNYEKD